MQYAISTRPIATFPSMIWFACACVSFLLVSLFVFSQTTTQFGPEQVLYSFQGITDGNYPNGGLVFDSSGNLYGTTKNGGDTACSTNGCGTVFKLSKNATEGWTETILHTFQGADGINPAGGLIFDQAGNLYGTTTGGGASGNGTVFELSLNGNGQWTESVLYNFQGGSADGAQPTTLTFDKSGNLFGSTQSGGNFACFVESGPTGPAPTQYCGTVFELSPNGSGGWTETTLFKFDGTDGAAPAGSLAFDAAGNLYGTTYAGGGCGNLSTNGFGCGLVFELSINGSGGFTENILYSFQGTTDGFWPFSGVFFDQAGNLYGTVSDVGINSGAVFEISPNGSGGWAENTLYTFQGETTADGQTPIAGLVFDQAGNLYTTTLQGGAAFSNACPTASGPTGVNFGAAGCGTVFEFSPNGSGGWTETVLYRFQGSNDGALPNSGLILDQSGNLYGETESGGSTNACPNKTGGTAGCGVVFEVSKEPFAVFAPTSISFGQQAIGTTSVAMTTSFTNSGNLPLNITSIQFTGTNISDFHQTNSCPSSLSPLSSCKISVTFTPATGGNENAFLSVTDNAPGSPQSVALSGTGLSGGITLSPTSIAFPSQYVGTSGLPKTVQVTNTGLLAVTISNVTTSASDFGTLNACGSSLQPSNSCSIGVFFDPSASGVRNGVLTINDSAADSPQTVTLTGVGQDFSMSASSSSTAIVSPGQTVNYTITVAPAGGFNQTVTLTCSGAPAQSTCSVSPASVKLSGSGSAPVTVTVTTAGNSASLKYPGSLAPINRLAVWLASGLPGIVLLAGSPRRRQNRILCALAMFCLLSIVMTWPACGGSSNGNGTPAGTYKLTVSGSFTSGSTTLSHATGLTLVVK